MTKSKRSILHSIYKVVVISVLSMISTMAFAIETASGVSGLVADASGNPMSGSTVTIRNENTGLTRSVQTNAAGEFNIRNLQVDDNYTVTVEKSGFTTRTEKELALSLGQTTNLTFSLSSSSAIEELVVVGSRIKAQVAVGPSAVFGLKELESLPSINRNITDILRVDPRIYVDESRGDINAIQCGGKNSRFNSLTLDGVRTNDSFGLNSNGYPTERIPFSYDAIKQVSVELAPFDAIYGGFTACNINAVTKSGSNEISASVFFDYTDDFWAANSLEGKGISTGDFDEKRWGINVGGPIIQDKLFFFVAYEKLDGANLFDRGAIGSGAVNEVQVTQAELDEIVQISRDLYQYDPGAIPSSIENEDEKLLIKLDWYITDGQRAAFTYNYNDGNNFTESDGDLDEFEFENHLYERGAELNSYAGTLYSDWNDKFSTEARIGYLEIDNRQVTVGGNDFGEIRVRLVGRAGLDDVNVYLGGDDSRQANKLDYDVLTYSLTANYHLDNGHSLSFGIEREELEVFNLFVQHTETEIRFNNIEDFRNGFASAIYYNNAPSNNPEDAAAEWGYELTSVFFQDEFDLLDNLTITAGLRYDVYSSDDKPLENADFVASYGFSNSTNLDGEGLFQPRLGVTYNYSDALTIRGGIGLYTGGDPNVWLSNNFSANNVLQFGQRGSSFGYRDGSRSDDPLNDGSRSLFDADVVYSAVEAGVPAGPGYGIPSELFDAVAAGDGRNFEINYLDPGFELPSEWKYALGFTYDFSNDYILSGDFLLTRGKDTAIVLHADIDRVGTTADGYPEYDSVREPAFVLTNSRNGNESVGASLYLSKSYDNGIDWTAGYAYTDAEDVSPMTSSVAFSNYQNRAFSDPQEQGLSTSNYNIKHRFTGTITWVTELIPNSRTIFSLYATANQGPSYSYTVQGNPVFGFTPFLDDDIPNVLEPGDNRNDQDGSWFSKIDVRVEQEFNVGPGQASVFIVIDNLTNLLNDEWGILRKANFPNTATRGEQEELRIGDASRYEIRFGMKYAF